MFYMDTLPSASFINFHSMHTQDVFSTAGGIYYNMLRQVSGPGFNDDHYRKAPEHKPGLRAAVSLSLADRRRLLRMRM